jgi:hypothetical protein
VVEEWLFDALADLAPHVLRDLRDCRGDETDREAMRVPDLRWNTETLVPAAVIDWADRHHLKCPFVLVWATELRAAWIENPSQAAKLRLLVRFGGTFPVGNPADDKFLEDNEFDAADPSREIKKEAMMRTNGIRNFRDAI